MIKPGSKELLQDPRVVEEIQKHLWLESEKAGRDIGFDRAAEDWLKRFSGDWLKFHPISEKSTLLKSEKSKKRY